MAAVIGILIVLAFIIAYVQGIMAMLHFLPYILVILGISVVTCVVLICVRGGKLSAKQKQQIAEAEALDRKNAQLNAELGKQKATDRAYSIITREREAVANLLSQAEDVRAQLKQCTTAMKQCDVLNDNDKDIATIDFLIEKLEGRRANSISEALNLLDAKRDRDEEERKRRERELSRMRFESEMRRLEQRQQAQRELEASLEQAMHNRRMEAQAKRLADEAETMRKNQEYYQRYGNS